MRRPAETRPGYCLRIKTNTVQPLPAALNRLLFCIAFFAAMLHGFSTTASYLLADDGKSVVEVCSSFGVKQVLVDAQGQPVDPDGGYGKLYCDFCAAGSMWAVLTTLPPLAATELTTIFPGTAASPSLRLKRMWVEQVPRAPPSFA